MRLTESAEFERVYKLGTAYKGKFISVHAFPSDPGGPRLGLSVSKRVGNAVVRNRVKRRLREIFYSQALEIRGDLDVVISAKPDAAEADYEDLEREFNKALRKIRDHTRYSA